MVVSCYLFCLFVDLLLLLMLQHVAIITLYTRVYTYYFCTGPDWQNNPDGLGSNSNFGSKVDRHKKKGSPVVPGSLIKVMDDNDSILYTVTVLRSMYEVREREW